MAVERAKQDQANANACVSNDGWGSCGICNTPFLRPMLLVLDTQHYYSFSLSPHFFSHLSQLHSYGYTVRCDVARLKGAFDDRQTASGRRVRGVKK